ncbi:MAG: nitroreductase family protein [Salibacteraceae bacterium]
MAKADGFIPYNRETYEPDEMIRRTQAHFDWIDQRRSVRDFSDRPVPKEVIDNLIRSASTAPSGANKQPWTFCAVSNAEMKSKIRVAAEKEEFENYHGRMSDEWLNDLRDLGTDHHKPFLEIAPWLIIVFKRAYEMVEEEKKLNYYVTESVGLASGFLLSAIHRAGLVALTHTPSPMKFLTQLLDRPSNERPFLLIPVGYPADEVQVPDIDRKPLDEVAVYY